jgi:hypothetical protein
MVVRGNHRDVRDPTADVSRVGSKPRLALIVFGLAAGPASLMFLSDHIAVPALGRLDRLVSSYFRIQKISGLTQGLTATAAA